MYYTSSKKFGPISTCHRNWRAYDNKNRNSQKCALIHGYSRYVELTFKALTLTNEGWVYDFGDCAMFKSWLDVNWDHKTLIGSDDPALQQIIQMHDQNLISIVVIPSDNGWNPGIEGSCKWLYDSFNKMLKDSGNERVVVSKVKIWEHENNYAEYGE